MNWRDLERYGQVIIFTIYSLENLKDIGFVTGGTYNLSDEGRQMAMEMEQAANEGTWTPPTKEEIEVVLNILQSTAQEEPSEVIPDNGTLH